MSIESASELHCSKPSNPTSCSLQHPDYSAKQFQWFAPSFHVVAQGKITKDRATSVCDWNLVVRPARSKRTIKIHIRTGKLVNRDTGFIANEEPHWAARAYLEKNAIPRSLLLRSQLDVVPR